VAVAEGEKSGHRYWLAELHHRRLRLLAQSGASTAHMTEAAEASLRIALEQNAIALLLSAHRTIAALGFSPELEARYLAHVERAKRAVEPGATLIVNPEPLPHGRE
jgi:predicted ATPase